MPVLEVNKENFQKEVMEAKTPVLLDFWAPWCGPCRTVAPILEEIAEERSDIKICKINTDEQDTLAKQFEIRGIPTLIVIRNGQIINRSTGAKRKNEILAMLR